MRDAVLDYRRLIVMRINPFIRRIECDGFSASQTASKLIEDYNARNFVTAGGWALEKLAVNIGPDNQKSASEGIDVLRIDPTTGDYHLYVLKSGLVTRNSDIMGALKKHSRQAEKLLHQGGKSTNVHAHYAILAGKTNPSFEDGINRPSSAEFWSHMTGLPEREAIDLVLAVAAEAGRIGSRDASAHIDAMKKLVEGYIATRTDPTVVDWEFIARRNMEKTASWTAEDKARHKAALSALMSTGYAPVKKPSKAKPAGTKSRREKKTKTTT
jgi:hypothetical protein